MIGGVVAICVLGAAGVVWRDSRIEDVATARPGARHTALHINCPPGSHGVPRYAKFGQSLGYGPGGRPAAQLRDRGINGSITTRTGDAARREDK